MWLSVIIPNLEAARSGAGSPHVATTLVDSKIFLNDHKIQFLGLQAVDSFTDEQKAALLRFITSCSRPPLLGFKYLEPQLCIQMAGSVLDSAASDRLPTAATCMNLLKLPPYRNAAQIRRTKLLFIRNRRGSTVRAELLT